MAYDSDQDIPSLPSGDSGTGNALKSVALTGDQSIDGVLTTYAWGTSSIDYSFPTTNSVYGYTQQTDLPAGFFALTTLQQQAARFALDADTGVNVAAKAGFSVEGFTNLGVNYDSTPDTDQIRLANTTASSVPTSEVADFPGNYLSSQLQDNGDVWFGTHYKNTVNDYTTPVAGNYAWHTAIHEIGHALGLKHAHENSLAGPVPANVDSVEYTVMTYRTFVGDDLTHYKYEQWGAPQTFMMLDIAALQHMYGADFTTNSGDTVYSWDPLSGNTLVNGTAAIQPGGNRIFATIWDGGGNDTYDLSHYASGVNVDLTPGGYSTFSSTQLANLDVDAGGPHYARGNIFNARLYQGDTRSLIENAIGGTGADTLVGNQGANVLTGGDGADTLVGNAGNDTLHGQAGADVLRGNAGRDILIGGTGNDHFDFDLTTDSKVGNAVCDLLQAGDGSAAAFDLPGAGNGDRIDVSTIDANTGASGNQTFVFGGTGAGHIHCINSGTTTEVLAYVNGDSTADFQLNIQDGAVLATAYTAADFIL